MAGISQKIGNTGSTGSKFSGVYDWRTFESSVQNVRYVIFQNNTALAQKIQLVEAGKITDEGKIEEVRDEVYSINSRMMKKWGLGRIFTKDFNFFDRSFINALIGSFPLLDLNRFGFAIMWERISYDEACEAVRYRIFKHRPKIKKLAFEIEQEDDLEGKEGLKQKKNYQKVKELKELIYSLRNEDLIAFGLETLINGRGVSHFNSRLPREILPQVFPDLELDPKLFVWQTYDGISDAEARVRSVFFNKYPKLKRLHEEIVKDIDANRKPKTASLEAAKEIVESITHQGFIDEGLAYLLNTRKFPEFKSSYIIVLARSFPHLKLKDSGHCRKYRWRTREEANENIREATFRSFPRLKMNYSQLQQRIRANKSVEITLRYKVGIPILAMSHGLLEKMGIYLTGAGPRKYFNGSIVQAMEICFPYAKLSALREEIEEQRYDLKASLALIKLINDFERISSTRTRLSANDRKILERVISPEFMDELNGSAAAVPKILVAKIIFIRKQYAPKILLEWEQKRRVEDFYNH